MSLTKQQIEQLRRNVCIPREVEFTESELREAVGMKKNIKGLLGESELRWINVADYVFFHFNLFSPNFRREVKQNFIEESMDVYNISKEEATKEVNNCLCNTIVEHMLDMFKEGDEISFAIIFQEIKSGQYNEFIDVDDIIPFR